MLASWSLPPCRVQGIALPRAPTPVAAPPALPRLWMSPWGCRAYGVTLRANLLLYRFMLLCNDQRQGLARGTRHDDGGLEEKSHATTTPTGLLLPPCIWINKEGAMLHRQKLRWAGKEEYWHDEKKETCILW
jgi:hypothetical protein